MEQVWSKLGHTASQIAEMLGDTTRNAVMGGKAHRLNLEAEVKAPSKQTNSPNIKTIR